MANGITGGLESILGLNTDSGTSQIQAAIAALQAVGVPTAAQLTLPELQKYVSAGVLTPAQYQAIQANPQAYTQAIQASQDNTGSDAQKAALQQLSQVVKNGGSTPINQANLLNNINTTNQAMQGARQGIMENAQERGVAGGGLEFINQLMNEQANANNANSGAVNAASDNAKLALEALTQKGAIGGQLQSTANQMSQAQAQAAQQIAEYNSQLKSAANQYNTQTANQAEQMNLGNAQDIANSNTQGANDRSKYNAQIPQTLFNDQMQKAGATANEYVNAGNLAQQQAANQNAFTGNLIGAGANVAGNYYMGKGASGGAPAGMDTSSSSYTQNAALNDPNMNWAHGGEIPECYATGGEVHDHTLCMKAGGSVPGQAPVPGDSTANDTVPARLSPHEIVLPRTVSMAPNAPQKAAQFVQQVKGQDAPQMGAKVNSFAEALAKLEENGLELRLAPKGQ